MPFDASTHFALLLAVLAILTLCAFAGSVGDGDIAVVVPDTPSTISRSARSASSSSATSTGPPICASLFIRAPSSRERDVVLKTIYQMSEAQFRQY